MLTKERLVELFDFKEKNGAFYRKKRSGKAGRISAGSRAGYISKYGYRIICIDYQDYFEHNLSWFFIFGEWPQDGYELDHINRKKDDNRISNLRLATRSQNNANSKIRSDNSSGVRGVYFDKSRKKYAVQVTKNGVTKNLGRYENLFDAAKIAKKAQVHAWGEFA